MTYTDEMDALQAEVDQDYEDTVNAWSKYFRLNGGDMVEVEGVYVAQERRGPEIY